MAFTIAILVQGLRRSPTALIYLADARLHSLMRDEAEEAAVAAVALADEHTILRAMEAGKRSRGKAARLRVEAAYYDDLVRRYEHAAHYPWLPVAPEPPEPK